MAAISPRGTYEVIAETLREDIRRRLRIGPQEDVDIALLPSETESRRRHGVARSTVRRALLLLKSEGLINSAPGIGWFVVMGRGRAGR